MCAGRLGQGLGAWPEKYCALSEPQQTAARRLPPQHTGNSLRLAGGRLPFTGWFSVHPPLLASMSNVYTPSPLVWMPAQGTIRP